MPNLKPVGHFEICGLSGGRFCDMIKALKGRETKPDSHFQLTEMRTKMFGHTPQTVTRAPHSHTRAHVVSMSVKGWGRHGERTVKGVNNTYYREAHRNGNYYDGKNKWNSKFFTAHTMMDREVWMQYRANTSDWISFKDSNHKQVIFSPDAWVVATRRVGSELVVWEGTLRDLFYS